MSRAKFLLLICVMALIAIGFSYAMLLQRNFMDNSLENASMIEFLPDECKVLNTSKGVNASIEFNRDSHGNIVNKTYIKLVEKGASAGSNALYSITAKNVSQIPLSVDRFNLYIDQNNKSLESVIYFSGTVKVYRNNGRNYDVLGNFKKVRLSRLGDNLTNIMKYRKIDITEKIVIELNQQFDDDNAAFMGKSGLSYRLMPVFVQYFPKKLGSLIVER